MLAGHSLQIAATGALIANGGQGGSGAGGGDHDGTGGGGGRITIETATVSGFSNMGKINALGYNSPHNFSYFSPAENGVVTINGRVVPAPGSLVVALLGAVPGGLFLLRRKRPR